VLRAGDLAGASAKLVTLDPPLRHRHGHGLARGAPTALVPGHWSGYEVPPDRQSQRDSRRGRAPPQADDTGQQDALAVVVGRGPSPDLDLCFRPTYADLISSTCSGSQRTPRWTTAALRTPEQADRWSWLIVAALTQLRLARGIVEDLRLPWERPRDPAQLTPAAGPEGGFGDFVQSSGTRPVPPKSTTPGPGRPKRTRKPAETRYPQSKRQPEQASRV